MSEIICKICGGVCEGGHYGVPGIGIVCVPCKSKMNDTLEPRIAEGIGGQIKETLQKMKIPPAPAAPADEDRDIPHRVVRHLHDKAKAAYEGTPDGSIYAESRAFLNGQVRILGPLLNVDREYRCGVCHQLVRGEPVIDSVWDCAGSDVCPECFNSDGGKR